MISLFPVRVISLQSGALVSGDFKPHNYKNENEKFLKYKEVKETASL